MSERKQLYLNLDEEAKIATEVSLGGKHALFESVNGFPVMFFPDGTYCFEFNAYLSNLFLTKRYSLVGGRGGTYSQYAAELSPLARFMFKNRLCSMSMSESRFKAFVASLHVGRNEDGSPVRDSNTIRKIGSTCLDMLSYMGEFYRRPNFVSPGGAIQGYRRHQVPEHMEKAAKGLAWYHACLPHPGPLRTRFPIGDIDLNKLYDAADTFGSYEMQQRNKILLSVYEHTGARRGEGASIKVSDVVEALASGTISPLIRVITYKRRGLRERWVPVARLYVQQWLDYIGTTRLITILERKVVDDGYLLINVKTGRKLAATTVSNILSDLNRAAKLGARAHVHMFRHRFITNKLKMIIRQFDFENQDGFKRALADFSGFREKLQQWTGHGNIDSLERYIHLACSELSDVGPSTERALHAEAIQAVRVEFDRIWARVERGEITFAEYKKLVTKTLSDGLGCE
ncbi:tyrosine-type recombinase/integrase [Pseudomonas putida]|uniref:tyrosine-type recombinase/integrase n=1 Tax=Pseudomonas putida TaxID=303 RepID=UPI001574F7A0|nr:site-specific integrase [Pseudomonas putida]NTY90444.1 site-specific integrase [Pseudomonas putida]NTY98986.1 site-specific integrase [Pseudomonas putida]NTZ21269.1 site-specific integrase [Pseudomonas putida]NTZ53212.1 site-specific integrase [Pseudomonas putida]NTZ65138.1 site-specific integrase [Pseudomonas putida]